MNSVGFRHSKLLNRQGLSSANIAKQATSILCSGSQVSVTESFERPIADCSQSDMSDRLMHEGEQR
jgi:hypothetical protein